MQDSSIFTILLPLALVIIMFGLGLSLTANDFRNVLRAPRPVFVALAFQTIVLPLVCFGLCYAFRLDPILAVGMMLLAASPGGTSSALYSHLADGDVALNITVTVVNSVLAIVTLPLIVNLSLAHFFGEAQSVSLPLDKILQIFGLVLVPMLIGIAIRQRAPEFADRMARPVKTLSSLFLVVVVVAALVSQWETLKIWGPTVGVAALAFNLVSIGIGYYGPRALGVRNRQAIASAMEISIHNAALAIAIALSPALLNSATMAIPAAIYGLLAYITAAGFVVVLKRSARQAGAPVAMSAR